MMGEPCTVFSPSHFYFAYLLPFGPHSPIKTYIFFFVPFYFPFLLPVLLRLSRIPPFFLVAGWRLSHPTQLSPKRPAAVHPRCALPAEGVQHSHPLPGGDAGLRPRKRGQEERRGERQVGRFKSGERERERRPWRILEKLQNIDLITPLPLSLSVSQVFGTLDEMISHHKHNQLLLIDSKSQAKHTAYLTHPARP